jgi:hypothetical protein
MISCSVINGESLLATVGFLALGWAGAECGMSGLA